MEINLKSLQVGLHRKSNKKPRWLNKNKMTKSSYRSWAYSYNMLPEKITSIIEVKQFKK